MMEKLFQRDMWVKIFSVALALVLWAFVLQDLSSQTRTREFEVKLKVRHNAALRVFEGPSEEGQMTVVVRVEGSPLYVNRLTADDIQAEVDYTRAVETFKTVQFEVKVTGPSNAPKSTTFVANPKTVSAILGEVGEKQVPVSVQPSSEVVSYQGKEWRYTAAAATNNRQAIVSGRTDLLGQVAQGVIALDPADKVPTNTRISKPITPLDAAGKPIDRLDRTYMDVLLNWEQLPPGRQVTIQPTTKGALPTGYVVTQIAAEPASVTLRAAAVGGRLPEVDTLGTTPIDLTGQTKTFVTTARLLPPSGTSVALETVNVTVTIAETTVDKTFKNVPIQVHGKAGNVEAVLSLTEAEIRLKGPYTALANLDPAVVSAYVDVENLAEGIHRLPIKVIRPQGVTEELVTPPSVEVTITIK